jgi:hypothetical protein
MQKPKKQANRSLWRFSFKARNRLWSLLIVVLLLITVHFGSQGAVRAESIPRSQGHLLAPAIQLAQANPPAAPGLNRGSNDSPTDAQPQQEEKKRKEMQEEMKRKEKMMVDLRNWAYLCVVFGGAFGGLIYGLSRNSGAILPHKVFEVGDTTTFFHKHKYDLGFLGDMLIGIGGGIIVFNLVPQANGDIFGTLVKSYADHGILASLLMKIAALSLIGGFAGISLFDEAAKRINREIQEARSKADHAISQAAEAASKAEETSSQMQKIRDLEAEIQYLLNPLVDPSFPPLNESDKENFKKLLLQAPFNLRNKVFERLQNAYNNHLLIVKDNDFKDVRLSEGDVDIRLNLQECLLGGFDCLIAAADEQERQTKVQDALQHRYYSHKGFIHEQLAVGYTYKNDRARALGQWNQGEENLTKAIQLRDAIPGDQEKFWFYNLDRILCQYKLGKEGQAIKEFSGEEIHGMVHKQPGVVKTQLKSYPDDFYDYIRVNTKDPSHRELLFGSSEFGQPAGQTPASNGIGNQAPLSSGPQPIPTPLTPLQRIRQGASL